MNRLNRSLIRIVGAMMAVCVASSLSLVPPVAMSAATVSPTCEVGQYLAQYYGSKDLSGNILAARCEGAPLNDTLGATANWPPAGVTATNQDFSVRWAGQFAFAAGSYTFTATADDGIRVYLDSQLVIDHWVDESATAYTYTAGSVTAGTHTVRVEYYNGCCDATARVDWAAATAQPPQATIASPSAALTYKVGDTIFYAGAAKDDGDAPVMAADLSWQILLHDCPAASCPRHLVGRGSGPTGNLTIPDAGDTGIFEFVLTATGHTGLKGVASVTIRPQTVTVTLDTAPSGLKVVYGGTSYTTPVTLTTIPGAVRTITAPTSQGGQIFQSWSDGGPAQHNITVDANPATYIATFGASSAATLVWATTGAPNDLGRPAQLALDSTGNSIFVIDSTHQRVQKFDTSGRSLLMWGSQGGADGQFLFREQPDHTAGIAVGRSGNVYVTDFNHRIQKFDGNGTFLMKWGTQGAGDGQFEFPSGVATDAQGDVYVVDSGNDRIEKFDSNGGFLGKWGSHGTGPGQFWGPNGIAVDGQGSVLVADGVNNRVQKFTSDGTFIAAWGGQGAGPGQLNFPIGIAVDGQGVAYVADNRNSRIQRFDSNGTFLGIIGGGAPGDIALPYPAGIAVDNQGDVFVTEITEGRLLAVRVTQGATPQKQPLGHAP